jgi:hypothetical protein
MDLTSETVTAFLSEYGVPLEDLRVVDMGPGPAAKDQTVFLAVIPRNAFTADEEILERNEELLDEVEMSLKNWDGPIFYGRARAVYITDKAPEHGLSNFLTTDPTDV